MQPTRGKSTQNDKSPAEMAAHQATGTNAAGATRTSSIGNTYDASPDKPSDGRKPLQKCKTSPNHVTSGGRPSSPIDRLIKQRKSAVKAKSKPVQAHSTLFQPRDAVPKNMHKAFQAGYQNALRESNHEIKRLEHTIADLEIQLERIKANEMTTMPVTLVVDQGGGSFTAYLFGPGAKQLQKFKSYNHADLMDHAVLSKLHAQTGVTLLAKDGTFNDYSAVLPRYFPLVTEALAAFYRAALGHMCVAQGIRVADVTTFKVRQTGKIRARLGQETADAVAARAAWEKSFRASLKHWHAVGNWDYALLDNAHEAEMEAGSFFSLSASAKNCMVGLGVGSSSTQGYARSADGHLCFAFDTCLGAKPTAAEQRDGKSWTVFQKQFHQLLAKLFHEKSQTTVVALNAIGYAVLGMTHSENKWDGQPAFASRVKDGKTFSPAELLRATEHFYTVCPDGHWGANLLRGFAAACSQMALDSALSEVLLERKKDNGKALPFEVSWIKYMVTREQVVRTTLTRMHSNGSTT